VPPQEDHHKYRDQLLYGKETLNTNEFLRILFDFGYRELEEGLNCTPQGIKKQTEAAEKAKKAAGLQLVDESFGSMWVDPQLKPDIRAKLDFSSNIRAKIATDKDFKSKIEAYRYFKEWVAIKFSSLYFSPYSKPFPPKLFFRWIVKDNILKKLEELKVPTTIRAQRFAEFVMEDLVGESNAKTEPTQPEPGPPATKGNRGRPKFPNEDAVKRAIVKLCKQRNKPTKKQMPFHTDIISAFAPGKEMDITEDTTPEEYMDITRQALSTIKKLVSKHYK